MRRPNLTPYFTPYVGVILAWILAGCSFTQTPPMLLEQSSYRVLLITPQIRFHDSGFVKKYQDRTELELYAMGRALYKVEIYSLQACMQQQCYPKILLIQNLLGDDAYAGLLEDIIYKRNIYDGENLSYKQTPQGLEIRQSIKRAHSSIMYVRTLYKTSYIDSKRNIKLELTHTDYP